MSSSVPNLQPEDFYIEGETLVFTAAYHRKRGYCCNSGCRHCPWRDKDTDEPQAFSSRPAEASSPTE